MKHFLSVASHNSFPFRGAGGSGKRLLYVHTLDEIYKCKITIRFCQTVDEHAHNFLDTLLDLLESDGSQNVMEAFSNGGVT